MCKIKIAMTLVETKKLSKILLIFFLLCNVASALTEVKIFNKYCTPQYVLNSIKETMVFLATDAETTSIVPAPSDNLLFMFPTYNAYGYRVDVSRQDSLNFAQYINNGGKYFWFGKSINNLSQILNIVPGDSSSFIYFNRVIGRYEGYISWEYDSYISLRGIFPRYFGYGDTLVVNMGIDYLSLGTINFRRIYPDTVRQGVTVVCNLEELYDGYYHFFAMPLFVLQFRSFDIDDKLLNKPDNFYLRQNYPNPFNENTTIKYFIPEKEKNSRIDIDIYNIAGQKIRTLINDYKVSNSGEYSVCWNGKDDTGADAASGIYFVEFSIGQNSENRIDSFDNRNLRRETAKLTLLR